MVRGRERPGVRCSTRAQQQDSTADTQPASPVHCDAAGSDGSHVHLQTADSGVL